MSRDRCAHCGLESVCQPCAGGNPPYDQAAVETQPNTLSQKKTLERVTMQLSAIPDFYAQLPGFLEPGSTPADPDARRPTPNPSRPTVRLDIVDLLDGRAEKTGSDPLGERDLELDKKAGGRRLGILGTLGLWVVMCRSELIDSGEQPPRCCAGQDEHTVSGEVAWLLGQLKWIMGSHPDFADDVDWMFRDLQRAVGERPPKPVPCRNCGGKVEGHDKNSWYQCVGCNRSWLADAEMARIGATASKRMTLRQIAVELQVPVKTLKNAVTAQPPRFLPVGRTAHGVRLYDLDVVTRSQQVAGENARAGGKRGRKKRAAS